VKGLLSPAEISLMVGTKNARKTFDTDGDKVTTLLVAECDAIWISATFGKVAPSRLPFYDALIAAITCSEEGRGRARLDEWEAMATRRGLMEPARDGETYRERDARTRDFRKAKSDLLAAKWVLIDGHVVTDLKGHSA
jgi:hypothetical protein